MIDLQNMLHNWSYVIASYGLVLTGCLILAVKASLRYKRSLSHLQSLEDFEEEPLQQQGNLS